MHHTSLPLYPTTLHPQPDIHMNTQDTLTALIDRTLSTLEKNADRLVADMTLIQAMEFISTLQDIRERHATYTQATGKKKTHTIT